MHQVLPTLWQTRTDSPFPGLTTHAFLWTGGRRNALFYSVATDADFDAIEQLGGIADQYLSHRDEAGPMLARIARRFGSRLHAPAAESAERSEERRVGKESCCQWARGAGRRLVVPTAGPGRLLVEPVQS